MSKEIRLTRAVAVNLNGWDEHPTTLAAGTHTVPDRIAEWVARNPAYGEVVGGVPAPADATAGAQDLAEREAAAAAEAAAKRAEEERAIRALKVAELRQLAAGAKVDGADGMKKDELVAVLIARLDGPQDQEHGDG